jgi:hypothetical protein
MLPAVPRSPSPALPAAPAQGPTPFALTPSRDDTALFQDARAGFSHLLPGRPTFGVALARPGDPPTDAILHLQDAPITIRSRLTPPRFAAASAGELARLMAERHAAGRAQARAPADRANDSWLVAWGVEAAAVASYELPEHVTPETGPAREDLFTLVRQGMVMVVSWTYPRVFLQHPAYATFASVAEATMTWDPARWEQHGRVWPEGSFLGPGLFGAPSAKYQGIGTQLAAAPILPAERMQVLVILSGIVRSAGAPWVPLAPEVVEDHRRSILSAVRDERLRAFVDEAFGDVRTAYDLRGLAIILGRALDVRGPRAS